MDPWSAEENEQTEATSDREAEEEQEEEEEEGEENFWGASAWTCVYPGSPSYEQAVQDRVRISRDGERVYGVKLDGGSCLGADAVLFEAVLPEGERSGRGRRLIYSRPRRPRHKSGDGEAPAVAAGQHRWVMGEFSVEGPDECSFRCVLPTPARRQTFLLKFRRQGD
jgi:hypothetical protein